MTSIFSLQTACSTIGKGGDVFIEEKQVYIANFGKYNEGELVGAWFTPPIDYDEMADVAYYFIDECQSLGEIPEFGVCFYC